jgi:hypothetical protein
MSYNRDYAIELNEILMTKRHPDDVVFTIHIPEHKFKKVAEKVNYGLTILYDKYKPFDIKLFHIVLSLQEYFEMDELVNTILDAKLTKIIKAEMQEEYHVSKRGKVIKNGPKKSNPKA